MKIKQLFGDNSELVFILMRTLKQRGTGSYLVVEEVSRRRWDNNNNPEGER